MIRDLLNKIRDGGTGQGPGRGSTAPKVPRSSRGWATLLEHIRSEDGLRVLDFGPTSTANINFLTGLGHSIWMTDIVGDSQEGMWRRAAADDPGRTEFDVAGFLEKNLDFGGRTFDVMLMWSTLDFLPEELVVPVVAHLRRSLSKGGRILTFLHTKADPNAAVLRFHVSGSGGLEAQEVGRGKITHPLTNRQIEKLFSAYAGCKFFLTQESGFEVIVTG